MLSHCIILTVDQITLLIATIPFMIAASPSTYICLYCCGINHPRNFHY